MKASERWPTMITYNWDEKVELAFVAGLLWGRAPEWFVNGLDSRLSWQEPKANATIMIASDTATSWHEGYRALREMGWQRTFAEREGGVITYILEYHNPSFPPEYQPIKVCYQVSLPTCRQVKVGTKEVDVFETVCDDLEEPEGEEPATESSTPTDDDILF